MLTLRLLTYLSFRYFEFEVKISSDNEAIYTYPTLFCLSLICVCIFHLQDHSDVLVDEMYRSLDVTLKGLVQPVSRTHSNCHVNYSWWITSFVESA